MAMPGERGLGGMRTHGWPCYDLVGVVGHDDKALLE
jgi:hypothetical protein